MLDLTHDFVGSMRNVRSMYHGSWNRVN